MGSIALLLSIFVFQISDSNFPKRIEVDIKKVYVPRWFDTGDIPQFIISGEFPDQCYRYDKTVFPLIEADKIYFKVLGYQNPGPCKPIKTPFLKLVDLPTVLDEGVYSLMNIRQNVDQPAGLLNIRLSESKTRDDFIYADVDSAVTYHDPFAKRSVLVLYGSFPNTCMSFDDAEIRVYQSAAEMIEVLPAIKKDLEEGCLETPVSFVKHIAIPEVIPVGRYVFFIRKMDGTAFVKFDEVGPKLRKP